MSWLLDTNIVSELTKPEPDPRCKAWVTENEGDCFLSTVTLAELRYGIERLPEGKKKSAQLRHFQFLMEDYEGGFTISTALPPLSGDVTLPNWKATSVPIGGNSSISATHKLRQSPASMD